MRGLVALGIGLIVVGGATLLWLLVAIPRPDLAATPAEVAAVADPPSLVWSLLAGLALAAGGACVGIGMNRWYQYR